MSELKLPLQIYILRYVPIPHSMEINVFLQFIYFTHFSAPIVYICSNSDHINFDDFFGKESKLLMNLSLLLIISALCVDLI